MRHVRVTLSVWGARKLPPPTPHHHRPTWLLQRWLQAPSGRGLPASIMHVLKAARSAVLVYKSNELF